MKEQFTTTVRVAGKGESKSRAFADALNHVQAAVMKSSSRILLRIEPQDVTVVHAREAVRKEGVSVLLFCAVNDGPTAWSWTSPST
ncbi:cytoplasmic protein [Klebsiella pneumoniae]|uniref:Cytoplasmic protein n=1 Tax=Klebsiella pneumoniae TaxID=573 RepID=A0A377USG7_KLEPN|nr:cytoplasmic protein [Klebsiella pneumoniae]